MSATNEITQLTGGGKQSAASGGESSGPELRMECSFTDREPLASGGMGDVQKAVDSVLHRKVAIKFLKREHLQNDEIREQFIKEAQVCSQLDHPGIIPVFGLGVCRELPFYVMRLVSQNTLLEEVTALHADGQFSISKLKAVVGRLKSVCDTIAFAHSKGIIHGDLKPKNILIGKYGETLVADWGSVLKSRDGESVTESAIQTSIPGTAGDTDANSRTSTQPYTTGYMCPEQIPDSGEELTKAADIYSLGATLYHVLTNHHQLEGLYRSLGRKQVKNEEVFSYLRAGTILAPRELNPRVPRPLDAICRKAMANKPEDRYRDASELARDLEAWRTDGRVTAYKERIDERFARSVRRHPQTALAISAACLMALVLALFANAYLDSRRRGAEAIKEQALVAGAQFAANMLASEIDLRWRILAQMASSEEVTDLLSGPLPPGFTYHPELQEFLERQQKQCEHLATSWLMTDRTGKLVARAPVPKNGNTRDTRGDDFSYRDYFHGQGSDLAEDVAERPKPLSAPYRTALYASRGANERLLTFAMPVFVRDTDRSKPKRTIGIIGMSVRASEFRSLKVYGDDSLEYSLVDFHSSYWDGSDPQGVYLHHPFVGDEGREEERKLLADEHRRHLLETWTFLRLRAPDLKPEHRSLPPEECHPKLIRNFADPTGCRGLAAVAPVILHVPLEGMSPLTQLVVVVQEKSRPAHRE